MFEAKYRFEAIENFDSSLAKTLKQVEVSASLNMANVETPTDLGGYFSTESLLQNQKVLWFCYIVKLCLL